MGTARTEAPSRIADVLSARFSPVKTRGYVDGHPEPEVRRRQTRKIANRLAKLGEGMSTSTTLCETPRSER